MGELQKALSRIVEKIRDEVLLWLIGILILAIIAGLRDRWTFIAVLVVGSVLIMLRSITHRRPSQPRSQITLTLIFPSSEDVDVDTCKYQLHDSKNKEKGNGEFACGFDNGWVCLLPEQVAQGDIIRLTVVDKSGVNWRPNPFRPFSSRVDMKRVP